MSDETVGVEVRPSGDLRRPSTAALRASAQGERWFFLLSVALLLSSSPALAAKTRVTLVSNGDEARAAAFERSLRELLARLELSLDVRGTDAGVPEGEALAAVEADFTEPSAVRLTVIDDLGRTVLVRRVARGGSDELRAEAAAHVVQSVMEELLTAADWKPPAVEPPPLAEPPLEPAPPPAVTRPATPRPPQGRFGVDFAAFFGGRTFLNGAAITGGGGVATAFAVRVGNFRPTLTVMGDYHAPFLQGDELIALKIESVSLRLLATLDVFGGDAFRVDVGLGGGADVLVSTPSSDQLPGMWLHPRRVDADPVVTAMIAGRLAIASTVDVFLAVSVDFDTWPVRYTARTPLGVDTLYQPFWVRPSLVLGFSFNAVGPDPYYGGGS